MESLFAIKRIRTADVLLLLGTVLPMFFVTMIKPVAWCFAVQLACIIIIAYRKYRSSVPRPSLAPLVLLAITLFVSVSVALYGV